MSELVYIVGRYDDGEPATMAVTLSADRALEIIKADLEAADQDDDLPAAMRKAKLIIAHGRPGEAALQRGWGGVILTIAELQ